MAKRDRDELPPAAELLRLNSALDEQVKALVKTEQRLFVSQRDLARQNARLDALNRFAIDAAALADPAEVLGRAANVLFSIFPLDQAVGFLATEGDLFVPVIARAAEGRGQAALGRQLGSGVRCKPPEEPVVGRVETIHPELEPLLSCVERIFPSESREACGALAMLIPLARQGGDLVGVMAFRRLSSEISFHEELPTPRDVGFLGVLARLVAASVTNARLVHDLTLSYERLAQAQRDLVDRERLAALGEFAAIVAHEVRNPLGVIFNARSLLLRLVQGEEATRLLEIVGEESERLDRMVGDLIDFARPHPPQLRPERALRIVESAVESVRASVPHADVTISADAELPDVWADARMLRQAMVNLVVNAVQSSGEVTPVVVRVAADPLRGVTIAVEDRGRGVPESIANRIFEPFFTTKATGTGLGLSVVKRAADAHGGRVELTRREGGGSVFVISIPITTLG